MAMGIDKKEFQLLFGKRVINLRTKQKLSYRQLAQRCDLDYSDISKVEKGERNIQLSTILHIAKGLGVQPKELFDFEVELGKD